jgi:hypothetical protein
MRRSFGKSFPSWFQSSRTSADTTKSNTRKNEMASKRAPATSVRVIVGIPAWATPGVSRRSGAASSGTARFIVFP